MSIFWPVVLEWRPGLSAIPDEAHVDIEQRLEAVVSSDAFAVLPAGIPGFLAGIRDRLPVWSAAAGPAERDEPACGGAASR